MNELIDLLSKLHGTWVGKGNGKFPTIESFEYEDTISFNVDLSYPMIHYEQKTALTATGEASHWESGFIRIIDAETIEISNSQDSGRVEVLRGKVLRVDPTQDKYEIALFSTNIANDSRLVNTKRIFTFENNTMEYCNFMSTTTTPSPAMLPHLHSILVKSNTPVPTSMG